MRPPDDLAGVDVVIATRDRPELLRRAIDAILRQDYAGQVDVVVVFDQTEPDHSLEFHEGNRSVKVVPNTRRRGLPGARNTGIEAGSQPLIAFCDDDDEWMAGKLSAQVGLLTRRPDVQFCTTGVVIDYDGGHTPRPSRSVELTVRDLVHDRHTEAHPSSFVFRRSLQERIGLVDEEIPGGYSEDYDWLIRAAREHPIACIAEPLVSIRWGTTSYFATKWKIIIDAQHHLLAKHPEFHTHRRAEARLRGQMAFAHAALGERRAAACEIARVLRCWPLEKRWPVACLVAMRVVSADRALAWAHRTGRGI